jgi:hypothetical protein
MLSRSLKRGLIACCLGGALSPAWAGTVAGDVKAALGSWKLRSVTLRQRVLLVHTEERMMTPAIFSTMVAVACTVLEKASGVSELRIVNFSGKFGFAFEDPKANCGRVLNAPLKKLDLQVAVSTHALP